jgi:hypothetical protein
VRELLPVAGLLLILGLIAVLRPTPSRQAPPSLPPAACQTWMADAIPGIGLKRRDAVAADIRAGVVPPAAQAWFTR